MTRRTSVVLSLLSLAAGGCRVESSRAPNPLPTDERTADAASEPAPAPVPGEPAPPQLAPQPNIEALLDGNCAQESVISQFLPSTLLFVLDRSASMACNPPPTTDSARCEAAPSREDVDLPSKWEIIRATLLSALAQLPSETVVGLSYFSNDDACGVHSRPSVPLAPLVHTHLSVVESSLGAVAPDGATPLVGATILAYRHLHQAALAGDIDGSKFVVLITDGSQSEACADSERCSNAEACTELLVEQEVPKAAAPGVGIKTFVIGAPGSEPARSVLSRIALQGGTAAPDCDPERGDCHFDMTTEPAFDRALQDALAQIAGRALTCDLPVPRLDGSSTTEAEIDLNRVNVIYSPSDQSAPQLLPRDASTPCSDGADGWQYAAGDTRIRLCGPTCDRVRRDRGARLDVVLGCPSKGPD